MSVQIANQETKIYLSPNRKNSNVGTVAGLPYLLQAFPTLCPKQEFHSKCGEFLYSFTHSEGTSPNKRILAVFVYENGYETFSYKQKDGWKHYLQD